MTDVTKAGLFDPDDSLVDRAGTYAWWAPEFSREHGVPLDRLLATDPAYSCRRPASFPFVRDTFDVPGTVDEPHVRYRRRMPRPIHPDPKMRTALGALRGPGWRPDA
ncbi:hypothetical protein ACH4PU_34910 [Streptomyces sp. NPDC021100]|uniref:hypothetical protein n=1 Tax=Streptomyces sp. NPDC021100 TaxID=3365114 RepID=UPI0037A474A5